MFSAAVRSEELGVQSLHRSNNSNTNSSDKNKNNNSNNNNNNTNTNKIFENMQK